MDAGRCRDVLVGVSESYFSLLLFFLFFSVVGQVMTLDAKERERCKILLKRVKERITD